MKRKTILIVMFSILLFNVIYANGDGSKQMQFEDHIVDSLKVEHPLLEKVFPGVEFFVETSCISLPPQKRIVGKLEGKKYGMPLAINLLYNKTKNKTKVSVENRIKLYFLLKHKSRDIQDDARYTKIPPFEIISIEKIEKKTLNYEYKYKVKVMYGKEIMDYFFYIENDFIKRIEYFYNGKYGGSSPIIKPKKKDDKQSRTIHFSADGINVVQDTVITPTDTYVHYYIKVSENGIATNDTIKIQVTGLTPLHPNTKLQIEPLYGYGGILVLDQLLVVDSLGTASYTWTPPNNDQTGFMEVKVNISGTDTYWDLTYIIPEHSKTGTFTSGYDYTIYYCNQFFAGQPPNPLFPPHPSGIAHAYTFAGYVENAVTESWINQVNDWELAFGCPGDQPTDYDGNYEIFINDSDEENSYHGTYGTYQEPGLERKIYNIVPFKDRIEFIKWHKIREEK